MWIVNWQIKASKWCNLRCRYCYEWNELDQRRRIPLEDWEKTLVAVKHYHDMQGTRLEGSGRSVIVFHGGEPLALPVSYWEQVLDLAQQILGPSETTGDFSFVVQTNLYAVSEEMLNLLTKHQIRASVSLDVVPGTRLTAASGETERRVAENIDRLRARGIPATCQVVLAGHTKDRLREVHDFFAERGIAFGLTPVFGAPPLAANPDLTITAAEAAAALEDLFTYWMSRSCAVEVFNLSWYLNTVLLRLASLERLAWDARENGERIFTVNTDGTLWTPAERYCPDRSLGNLFHQSLDEILESPAYEDSLFRRDQLARRHCHGCRYAGACDGEPIFATPRDDPPGPCPIASRLCRFIEDYLCRAGYDERRIQFEVEQKCQESFFCQSTTRDIF